jgi:hypothetical protein
MMDSLLGIDFFFLSYLTLGLNFIPFANTYFSS